MPHPTSTEQECLALNNQYPESIFVWNNGSCDKTEGFLNSKEYFEHSEEGTSDKGNSNNILEKNNSNNILEKNNSNNIEEGTSDKGNSDKGNSEISYSDTRNANYLRAVYLLHILVVVPLFLACCFGKHF